MLTSKHILEPITITQIEQASGRIRGSVLRTPIVRLNIDSDMEIYLKLENLQPTGSFKVRGASNAIALAGPAAKSRGVYTCSAGNMAQALAWQAKQTGSPVLPSFRIMHLKRSWRRSDGLEPRSFKFHSMRSGKWLLPIDMAHWRHRFSSIRSVTQE